MLQFVLIIQTMRARIVGIFFHSIEAPLIFRSLSLLQQWKKRIMKWFNRFQCCFNCRIFGNTMSLKNMSNWRITTSKIAVAAAKRTHTPYSKAAANATVCRPINSSNLFHITSFSLSSFDSQSLHFFGEHRWCPRAYNFMTFFDVETNQSSSIAFTFVCFEWSAYQKPII